MLKVPSTESELQSDINSKFTDSEQFMEPIRAEWRGNELLYNGDHLGHVLNNNVNSPQIQANIVLSIISTEMPIVMNNIPVVNALPRDANDVLLASILDKTLKDLQRQGSLLSTLEQVGLDYKIYSNGIWSYVPIIKKGELVGREYKAISPFGWFPSPDALDLDINTESTYQIFARVMSIQDIKAHPTWKNTDDVKEESNLEQFLSFNRRSLLFNSTGTAKSKLTGTHALVKQMFFVDPDKTAYPTGRMITFTESAILEDRAIFGDFKPKPTDDFNQFLPYKMVKNHGTEHSLFGRGEPEILKTVAVTLNEVLSATAQNIRMMGNPAWHIDPEAANEMELEILGIPGEQITAPMGMLKQFAGMNMPSTTFAFIELLYCMPEIMTGAERSLRGDKPAGVESGRAILALQQQASTLLESQTRREFRKAMKEFVEFEIWTIKNFAKEVVIRDEGLVGLADEMDVDQIPDSVTVSQSGDFTFTKINFQKALKDSRFDIEISEGTSIPKGSAEYEQLLDSWVVSGKISLAESIRQSGILEDKGRLIADLKTRDAASATIEREQEAVKQLPQFRQLVKEATGLLEAGTSPQDFANTPTAMNLSTMIDTFREYLDTPEWLALDAGYKQVVLQVFMETPEEDRQIEESGQVGADTEVPSNGQAGGDIAGQIEQLVTQTQ